MSENNHKYPPPFSMRFGEDERKSLELAAAGRPLAAYIRWLIFEEDMPDMPKKRTRGESASLDHKKLAKLLGALGKSRIASNINQLVMAANSGSLPVNIGSCAALNEKETSLAETRDQKEREHLIKKQLIMRQNLQVRLNQLQLKHEKDLQQLIHDLSHMARAKNKAAPDFSKLKEQAPTRSPAQSRRPQTNKKLDIDMEPEI